MLISCPTCKKMLSVKEDLVGKKVKCPGCGAILAILAPASVPAGIEEQRTVLPAATNTSRPVTAEPATSPFLSKPDCTQSNDAPRTGHDASLTDFLAPAQSEGELGRLGKHRILKILGHGGMGVVFLGEDPTLGRMVAIKAMLPHLAQSKSSRDRFFREAQSAARLEHDHIVAIHHVDEDRGAPYIVMPFLKGESLEQRLQRPEPLPIREIIRIGREMAEALATAHAAGLIHRDIKPGNVWLEALRDRVKVLDFGLARAASQESGLTQQGAIIGTPAYMSPEQARGDNVDGRCDLFSLGIVLYRLCTGEQPFRGNDTVSTLMSVSLHEPPPPIALKPDLPQELSDLVMKLLEKDRDRRISTAQEVVTTLQTLEAKLASETMIQINGTLKTEPLVGAAGSGKGVPRRRGPAVAAALCTVFGLIIAGVIFYWQTNIGLVTIEINDKDIQVAFDNKDVIFKNLDDKQEIHVSPGKHGLHVKKGSLEFDTQEPIIVKRGDKIALRVVWDKDRKLALMQGDKVLGSKEIALQKPPEVKGESEVAMSKFALAFDGQGSHVTVPTLKYDGSYPLTVEGWVVLERGVNSPLPDFLMGNYNDGSRGLGISTGRSKPPRKWSFDCVLSPYELAFVEEKQPPPRQKLVHLAGVYDVKSELRFYVDGQLQSRRPAPGLHHVSDLPFTLGACPGGEKFKEHFLGRMNEVRVSRSARYDKDFTPANRFKTDADTLAIYHFEEGSGGVLHDSSGKGHDGQIVSAKWVRADGSAIATPPPTKDDGFVSLFNGKDLKGWTTFPKGPGNWKVVGGNLTCSGAASYLFTERDDYKDFHFRVEARINTGGNSGQYFRCPFSPGTPNGYFAQINNSDPGVPDRTGSLMYQPVGAGPGPLRRARTGW